MCGLIRQQFNSICCVTNGGEPPAIHVQSGKTVRKSLEHSRQTVCRFDAIILICFLPVMYVRFLLWCFLWGIFEWIPRRNRHTYRPHPNGPEWMALLVVWSRDEGNWWTPFVFRIVERWECVEKANEYNGHYWIWSSITVKRYSAWMDKEAYQITQAWLT